MSTTGQPEHLFFRQYYLDCLSQASYLVGDLRTGRAVVVDPRRDTTEYVDDAAANGLSITHVIETHFHADFLSGHLELAGGTGAEIVYGASAAGRVGFPIRAMADGERLDLGGVSLVVLETPGHTPESISVVIHVHPDREPFGVLTGDTLFVGDVGRPDLLAAAGVSADVLARQLYHSLRDKLLTLPDATRVFPAHGAGSACGKHLSTETVSTIGEQRRTNYALAPMSEDDFVAAVTEGQSAAPLYFSFAANKNRESHQVLDERIDMLSLDDVLTRQAAGAVVIDGRDATAHAAGHLRGSINVGLDGRFAEYVGAVVRPGTPIIVVTEPGDESQAKVRLARIGFDTVIGALASPHVTFTSRPDVVERASRLTAAELDERRAHVAGLQVVDVRNSGELADGMLDGARHIALPTLLDRLGDLDPSKPTVVYCAGGYRSSIAASTLRANGFHDVSEIIGGFGACRIAGVVSG
jgi:glyoxylase-like metal-dependent hydrolase (beta-lactamase superfamily II)/rhodanese-related sulfurtransferase